jgi:hypothetical protein
MPGKPEAVRDYVFSPHALREIARRGLSIAAIHAVLRAPQQRMELRPGRAVLQSRIVDVHGRIFLLRVFVDVARRPAEVVTAYRTSKVAKYWRRQS